jgi:hypothetical protein
MPFNRFRGGKLPPKRHLKLPALGDFLDKATSWPAVPARGWEFAVPDSDLDILGNDKFGDCAEAGALHLIQAESFNVGRPLIPTTEDTLGLYTALTGFNPNDPSTDQGTVLTDLLTYWKNTGISVGSTIHKIVGYASVDISSVQQMRYAAYTFGGLYIGLNLPAACEQDTDNWNFGPGQQLAGGHCVIVAGEGSAGGKIGSWGMWIPSTWEFLLSYMDEGYVICSSDWINAQEKSPTGLDLDGLLAAMKAL